MFDQICDVITCCVLSCDMGKINVGYMIYENTETNKFFYINLHLKDRLGMEFTVC